MDTRRVLDNSSGPGSLSVTYNADNSYFAVGLETGFRGEHCYSMDRLSGANAHGSLQYGEMRGFQS